MTNRRTATTLVIAFAAVPATLLILWSLTRGWNWPQIVPRTWSLHAWRYLFAPESGIAAALGTSAGIAAAVSALSVLAGIPAGRVLAYEAFPGKRGVLFLLLLPVLAPPLAAAMGVHLLFLRYGLAETATGVILIHLVQAVPYATLMIAGSFSRFDPLWEAQARTLGAGRIATWTHVTLPGIAPGLGVAAAFAFLISWSQYLLTLLIGGGRTITLPLLLVNFQRGGDDAITAALSLLYLLPAVAVFGAVARVFSRESWR